MKCDLLESHILLKQGESLTKTLDLDSIVLGSLVLGATPVFYFLGKKYGTHNWGLLSNSKGIMVVKCIKCRLARLHLMGFDKEMCTKQ